MKLYHFPVAPNPARVIFFLKEKQLGGHPIDVERVLVDFTRSEQGSPEFLTLNPAGTVPVLELDDGTVLAAINFAKFGDLAFEARYPHLDRWFDRYALRHL